MALAQAPKTEDTSAAGMPRLVWLDRARGAALVAMIVFHAAWNAVQFGAVAWTAGRDAALAAIAPWIAGSFLVISGAALALAAHAAASRGQELIKSRPFLRRLALLVLAASAVNVGSWLALPQAPIYFGVLHHIAVASVLLALLAGLHAFAVLSLGAAALLVGAYVAVPAMNHPALVWLGLGTQPPVTADWVPLVPWFAAGAVGFALSKAWLVPWLVSRPPSAVIPTNPSDPLSWMGRHSLLIYLIHQPILFGLLMLYQAVTG